MHCFIAGDKVYYLACTVLFAIAHSLLTLSMITLSLLLLQPPLLNLFISVVVPFCASLQNSHTHTLYASICCAKNK